MRTEEQSTLFPGEQQLIERAKSFQRKVEKINDRIWFFAGFGGSNMTAVIGDDCCILIDALNGKEVAEDALAELRKITDKPIQTIIYTHTHFDHTSGAGVFVDEDAEIIGHSYKTQVYGHSDLLKAINQKRGKRQFGPTLTQEENVCVGIGIWNNPYSTRALLHPNSFIDEDVCVIHRGGIEFQLVFSPGETDDHMYVWMPEFGVMCCGDNYYASWPNLYAIRGSQYRDINAWTESLNELLEYPIEVLIPGHTDVIYGQEIIHETITNYKDAIEYVLIETLKGIDVGMTPDELVEHVVLPEQYATLPYLQEYYGTVKWTVRAIFDGYLGWFDGNPTNLDRLTKSAYANRMIALIGSVDKILEEIDNQLERQDYQWVAELCDILLATEHCPKEVCLKKAQALEGLGHMQLSANARHYYLVCAKELSE